VRKIKSLFILFIIVTSSYAQENNSDSTSSTYVFDAYIFNGYELGYNLFSKDIRNLEYY